MEGMVGPARRSERAPFFLRGGEEEGPPGDSKGPPFFCSREQGGWVEGMGRAARASQAERDSEPREERNSRWGGGVISREWREWSGEPGGVTERGGEEEVPRNNGRASQAERESALFCEEGKRRDPHRRRGL